MVTTTRFRFIAFALLFLAGVAGLHGELSAQEPVEGRTHEVTRGETLWGLAQRYYENGHLWQRILEANRDRIQDPDVLEPGLVLTIPPATGPVTQAAPAVGEEQAARARVQGVEVTAGGDPAGEEERAAPVLEVQEGRGARPVERRTAMWPDTSTPPDPKQRLMRLSAVSRDVAWSAPWLVALDAVPEHDGRLDAFAGVEGEVSARRTLLPRDRVRLTFQDGTVPASGTLLQAFRVARTIQDLGRVAVPTAILRVESQEPGGAMATVESVYARAELGDLLRPVPDYGVEPGTTAEPVTQDTRKDILGFARDQNAYGLNDLVFLGGGAAEGDRLGDEYLVVYASAPGWDDEVEGRLQVVAVHPDHVTARIVDLESPIFDLGPTARLDRRLMGR